MLGHGDHQLGIHVGAIATVGFSVTPLTATGGTTIINVVSVSAIETDSDSTNNSIEPATTVDPEADLSVATSGLPSAVFAGDVLAYTLTVTNHGPSQATGVVLTEARPANVSFGSAIPSQGSCSEASGAVTCSLGVIDHRGIATVAITVTPGVAMPGRPSPVSSACRPTRST